jgi:hypothetical protein
MPGRSVLGGNTNAETFMMAAMLVYAIVAAACSSPQTTELNAGARAETLMKWVSIGMVQSGIFILIAAALDHDKWPVLLGGGLAGAMMWVSYAHAKSAGLKNGGTPTEQY